MENIYDKTISINLVDAAQNAIHQMENCMAYISKSNHRMAHVNYGMAAVYESLLAEEGIILEEINEHYKTMLDIYYETYFKKD